MFRRFHIESSRRTRVWQSGIICAIREGSINWNTPAYIFNLDQLSFKAKIYGQDDTRQTKTNHNSLPLAHVR